MIVFGVYRVEGIERILVDLYASYDHAYEVAVEASSQHFTFCVRSVTVKERETPCSD